MHLSRCVLVFAPLIHATVELPPQSDELSNNTILPSFSSSVLAADISAQPPPTRSLIVSFDCSSIIETGTPISRTKVAPDL